MLRKLGAESKRHLGKYSFVNRNIQFRNQLPANAIGILSCKPRNFMKKLVK
jgi:hypothetical protein